MYPRMQDRFDIWKLTNVTHHINWLKKHFYIVISTDTKEKALDKTQRLLTIKTLSNLEAKENFFNLIKNIYKNPAPNILSGET